jgi:DNA-binding CsgD family transcriptional regulator
LASRCGSLATVARARDELIAAGARPRRERLTGPDSLTASELRVARLAAEGRSNPEIAQALFVTRRTVEVHLTHVYRKLDIESREELSSALGAA